MGTSVGSGTSTSITGCSAGTLVCEWPLVSLPPPSISRFQKYGMDDADDDDDDDDDDDARVDNGDDNDGDGIACGVAWMTPIMMTMAMTMATMMMAAAAMKMNGRRR